MFIDTMTSMTPVISAFGKMFFSMSALWVSIAKRCAYVIRTVALIRVLGMRILGRSRGPARIELEDETDAALLKMLIERRSDAFDELYRRHAPAVNATSRRLFGDPDLANEATQVAFLRLWDRAGGEPETRPRPWLVRVAYNAGVDRMRRKRVSTTTLANVHNHPDPSRGPDEDTIVKEQRCEVRSALGALPNTQRDAIELAYFGGLSQSEIADLIGVPLGTVKGRIRLGMQRLRALLSTTGEPA